MRSLLAFIASMFTCVLCVASPAEADEPWISAGEVSTHLVRRDTDLARTAREVLADEIANIERRPSAHRVVVVSLTVMRLSTEKGSSRCEVSASVRTKKEGRLLAILEGKATAIGGHDAALERSAIEHAVHGALQNVPDAVARADAR